MSHISVDKIIGTSPFNAEEIIPGLDIRTFREMYQETFEQRQLVTYRNIKTRMPDGDTLFISGSLIPLSKDGLFDGMICTIYDTTTSHILRKLLINTLNFCDHGIGIVQQTSPGEYPKVYFKNNKFSKIFGLDDIDPSKVPFSETLKLMASRMKNGKKWLEQVKKSIYSNTADIQLTIIMKNNKKYNWVSNPLVDEDGNQWGRIAIVEEIKKPKKKATK
jgi:hypothetical protein